MMNGQGLRAPVAHPVGTYQGQSSFLDVSGGLAGAPVLSQVVEAARRASEPVTFETDNLGVVVGQLALARQGAALIVAAFAALGMAAFVCDSLAIVRALTPVAESALGAGRLRLVNGRLAAPRRYDSTHMESAIAAAASRELGAPGPMAQIVVNRDPRDPSSVQVIDVIALPREWALSGFEPRAVVVLRGGEQSRAELEPILARAFGLTPAEAEIAARLATGEPRATIAAERGASLQTVRSQIKSVFAKLNVTRERELVSMLAKITQR